MNYKEYGVTTNQILAFFAMCTGAFMAFLDVQIVACSLDVISSGLSTTLEETSWIQTSYLIAEVIVIPISGFIAKILSIRYSFTISSFLFTIFSILCALATNIETMIIFRFGQGFFGGMMIPSLFSVIYLNFPQKLHGKLNIIAGYVVILSVMIGPTIGGIITEYISWHFIFLINIIPGIFVSMITFYCADFGSPNFNYLNNFDYFGVFLIFITLGSTQYILEEGADLHWFDSEIIVYLSITAFIGLILLVYNELSHINPIVNLRAFKNFNFLSGCFFSIILGIGMFGTIFLNPIFLSKVTQMTTIQIGIIMSITGFGVFFTAPLAGYLFERGLDRRIILFIGLSLYGLGTYLNSFLTEDSRFWEFVTPFFIRGFSLMFCFLPINDLALGTLPKEEIHNSSSLYNLMRNLGGAFGLAVINSSISSQTYKNKIILLSNIHENSEMKYEFFSFMKNTLSSQIISDDEHIYKYIYKLLEKQSFIISVNYIFTFISILFALSLFVIPFTKDTSKFKIKK